MTATATMPTHPDIAALGPWFHNLHLPDGSQTCPNHPFGDFPAFKWRDLTPHVPADLTGWSCLDIGCNAGFYTFELARRGARVLGIDLNPRYLRQAQWAAGQFGPDVEGRVRFEQMQVYDLARSDEAFDLVLFMGVFYHLRYPMLGLDLVCERVRRLMVFQTLTMPGDTDFDDTHGHGLMQRHLLAHEGWPKMAFIEHEFADDPTNWWAPNHAAALAMLRSAGMRVTGRPGHEMYLCEPDPSRPSCVATWNRPELLSATGQAWRGPARAAHLARQ
jgi:tRNA (mo5U34)-methyltransferase